jgi:CMP/dCMP kinase
MDNLIITIDGPSGTGKSITARMLAEKLDVGYFDSGSYYRAITYAVLRGNIKQNDYNAICKTASSINLKFIDNTVLLNDKDITSELKALEITNKVSNISRINALRRMVNERLKKVADTSKGLIMEGKDTGVNVFPEANYKFYIISDLSTRVARRHQDFLDLGQKISKDKIEKELKLRDEMEMRKNPVILKKAEKAIEVDTTNMIIEEQVNYLYRIITNPDIE